MKPAVNIQDFTYLRGQVDPLATIIAVGGGKGGIGKSFVSSSLAIFLAHMGFETTLVDLDLGAANLHTSLGVGLPDIGINEFLEKPELTLPDVTTKTPYPRLSLIAGSTENYNVTNVNDQQKTRLMSSLYKLNTKFIILDLSAGTHDTTIDFFLSATRRLVVMTPEPSSIENAYRFMKASFYKRLKRFEFQLHLQDLIDGVIGNKSEWGIRSPSDLLRVVCEQDPTNGERLRRLMDQMQFELILNQSRSFKDTELGPQMKSVCQKYFGVPCDLIGQLEYDNAVWQSLRKKKPLLIEYPHSRLYAQLLSISRRLIVNAHSKKVAV